MSKKERAISPADLPIGSITRLRGFAVGNNGDYFAVSRRCRHLGADLSKGAVDRKGCIVCPSHGAAFDVESGRMVRGPGGTFAKLPGAAAAFKLLTRALPLRRRRVVEIGGMLYLTRP